MAVDDEWDLLDIMDSDGTGLEHEAREDNWDAVECDVESSGDVVVVVTFYMQSKKAFSDLHLFAPKVQNTYHLRRNLAGDEIW